jgi:hypothetical protein
MSAKSKKSQTETLSEKGLEDQVQLFGMGIESCACKLDRPNYLRMRKRRGDSELRLISAETKLEDSGEFYFDGSVAYTLLVRDKRHGVDPLIIECTFQAHFHGPKVIVKKDADRFLQTYFKVVSWPYFRQFVSDMTARMAIAPLVLPLLPNGSEE